MRLFVAICLPPGARRRLMNAARMLESQGSGRLTREQNLHLTLAFLGETDHCAGAERALSAVRSSPFSLELSDLGRFGAVYWAGVAHSPALLALHEQLTRALEREGFCLERREFTPHLTLCRAFCPSPSFDPKHVEAALRAVQVPVDRICLMRSERIDGVLTYTELAAQPLVP